MLPPDAGKARRNGVGLGELIGFSCGFRGFCWVGVLAGLVWVFERDFFGF